MSPAAPGTKVVSTGRKGRKSRVPGLDAARVLATFGIVWVHTAEVQGQDPALVTLGRFGTSFYILAAVFFAARSHIGRPERRTIDVARARARRLLVPFLLWSMVYATFYFSTMLPQGYSFVEITRYWGPLFGAAPHLWFLPYAFVAGVLASLTVPRLIKLPGALLIALSIPITLAAYVYVYRWGFLWLDQPQFTELRLHRISRWAEDMPLVLGAIFGVAIYAKFLPQLSRIGRAKRTRIAAIALVTFGLTQLSYYLFLEPLGAIFWNRVRIFAHVAGAAWLVMFVALHNTKFIRRLAPLGAATYFAYLSHQLILDATKRLLTFGPGYGSLAFSFASSLGIFALAVGSGLLVARVRLLRWLRP